MVQRGDLVPLVYTADGEHGQQDMDVGEVARITSEQCLDLERPVGLDDEVHNTGDVTRGTLSTISLTWAMTMPDRNAVASAIVGVSSVFGPVESSLSADCCKHRDLRRQVEHQHSSR